MKPAEASARRRAREAALQMLYQWEVGRTSPGDSILSYWPAQEDTASLSEEYREFANALVRGTTQRVGEIDALLGQRAQNWRVERMAVLDRLVLRLFVVQITSGTPIPGADHDAVRWLEPDALDSLDWLASDRDALPFVRYWFQEGFGE